MTEKRKLLNPTEQITFYETFDDEIVRINRTIQLVPSEGQAGPRRSYPPTPVIPGFYTLSDAFENARRRLEAEETAQCAQDPLCAARALEDSNPSIRPGHPLIQVVPPGQFSDRAILKAHRSADRRKQYLAAGQLIEDIIEDEVRKEPGVTLEERLKKSRSFDTVLDETMRSLVEEETGVRSG